MNSVKVELSLGDAKDVYRIIEFRIKELEERREYFLCRGLDEMVGHVEREILWLTILQRKFDV